MKTREQLISMLAPYSGQFLHAVIGDDPVAQHNLEISGQLLSPEYVALVDKGVAAVHQSLRDTPLAVLAKSGPTGVYSPFASWRLWAAAIIRSKGHVGRGVLNTAWLDSNEEKNILHAGDVELAFERARRQFNPEAASRLTSLYVVEDSAAGRKHLQSMFASSRRLIRVRIQNAIRVSRCDTTWFERYFDVGGEKSLENYWSGVAVDTKSPRWEYLVDGVIQTIDS